ncbi:hypothetical protein A464_3849 [Salmonella bongori N268-08]|uniref:Uncharacterized protein n=1 Tax=Salmonella bongori N268-08 TaxID=1197719 RepID=S5N243_SALBN|nr:hypothetical protein A464_3849 [Salmonella bongori N268-08]
MARINQIMRISVTKQDTHHNDKFMAVDILACQNVIYKTKAYIS